MRTSPSQPGGSGAAAIAMKPSVWGLENPGTAHVSRARRLSRAVDCSISPAASTSFSYCRQRACIALESAEALSADPLGGDCPGGGSMLPGSLGHLLLWWLGLATRPPDLLSTGIVQGDVQAVDLKGIECRPGYSQYLTLPTSPCLCSQDSKSTNKRFGREPRTVKPSEMFGISAFFGYCEYTAN